MKAINTTKFPISIQNAISNVGFTFYVDTIEEGIEEVIKCHKKQALIGKSYITSKNGKFIYDGKTLIAQ